MVRAAEYDLVEIIWLVRVAEVEYDLGGDHMAGESCRSGLVWVEITWLLRVPKVEYDLGGDHMAVERCQSGV